MHSETSRISRTDFLADDPVFEAVEADLALDVPTPTQIASLATAGGGQTGQEIMAVLAGMMTQGSSGGPATVTDSEQPSSAGPAIATGIAGLAIGGGAGALLAGSGSGGESSKAPAVKPPASKSPPPQKPAAASSDPVDLNDPALSSPDAEKPLSESEAAVIAQLKRVSAVPAVQPKAHNVGKPGGVKVTKVPEEPAAKVPTVTPEPSPPEQNGDVPEAPCDPSVASCGPYA